MHTSLSWKRMRFREPKERPIYNLFNCKIKNHELNSAWCVYSDNSKMFLSNLDTNSHYIDRFAYKWLNMEFHMIIS